MSAALPRRAHLRLALLALLACACDPQADQDYVGEPLLTITGSAPFRAAAGAEAALLWSYAPPLESGTTALGARGPVELTGGLASGSAAPRDGATFSLTLYQPPPEEAFQVLAPGEPRYAWASVTLIPEDASDDGSLTPIAMDDLQLQPTHWVVYLADPVPEDSLTAWWLGGALPRGYAVLRIAWGCPSEEALAACVADLDARGLADRRAAGAFCRAPYRLTPVEGEEIAILAESFDATGTCP